MSANALLTPSPRFFSTWTIWNFNCRKKQPPTRSRNRSPRVSASFAEVQTQGHVRRHQASCTGFLWKFVRSRCCCCCCCCCCWCWRQCASVFAALCGLSLFLSLFLISLPHRLDIGYLSSAALLAARQTLRLPLALRMLNPSSIRILHHVKCLFDIVVLVRWLFLLSCSFLQTHPFASITSLLPRVVVCSALRVEVSADQNVCVCLCVFVFFHLSVCFWSSEYTCCTCSSPYPVRGKFFGEICRLNFFTMETLVKLGQVCCTSLMCLVHLLWMSIAVAWHA